VYQVNRFPIYVCFAFVLCLPLYKATAESCTDSLDSYRTENETYFLRSEESPFSEEFKTNFAGFSYFQGDEQYCVDATFELINNGKTIDYPTFDGKTIPFRKIGVFRFSLEGATQALTANQRMDLPESQRQWALVMFRDRTNSFETYGGGRYLQIDLPIQAETTIDFNRSANPYCAYQATFVCPVPPVENWLKVRIPAGEKDYSGKQVDAT
jgi:uncharacterized protein (DUF1684 family)